MIDCTHIPCHVPCNTGTVLLVLDTGEVSLEEEKEEEEEEAT